MKNTTPVSKRGGYVPFDWTRFHNSNIKAGPVDPRFASRESPSSISTASLVHGPSPTTTPSSLIWNRSSPPPKHDTKTWYPSLEGLEKTTPHTPSNTYTADATCHPATTPQPTRHRIRDINYDISFIRKSNAHFRAQLYGRTPSPPFWLDSPAPSPTPSPTPSTSRVPNKHKKPSSSGSLPCRRSKEIQQPLAPKHGIQQTAQTVRGFVVYDFIVMSTMISACDGDEEDMGKVMDLHAEEEGWGVNWV